MIPQRFDVIVVGAGLAGSAFACALGDSGLRIALIEARPLELAWPDLASGVAGFDRRVSAVTEASRAWLATMGVWQGVAARRVAPYRHMHVWEADGTGCIDFDAREVNSAALGHIVESGLLQAALLHRLADHDNVQVIGGVTVADFRRGDGGTELQLVDKRRLQTRLLIAADGAESAVRNWAGIACREWAYDHTALVATIATERPHAATAWQIFHRDGPLALLPLPDPHYCSIVWSTTPEHAARLQALDDRQFATAIGTASEHRLGEVHEAGPRASFPLRARHARQYVTPGVALLGDAAHTIHPLAGQGINLGFADGRVLAEELRRARRRGLDPADSAVLARYERRRKGENLGALIAMEGFKRLFAANALPVRLLRNQGLRWVDGLKPIKRMLIAQAMGTPGSH